MSHTVFQYVLLHNPKEQKPSIIDNGFVVAQSIEKARIIASRKLSENWETEFDNIEVLVRPF